MPQPTASVTVSGGSGGGQLEKVGFYQVFHAKDIFKNIVVVSGDIPTEAPEDENKAPAVYVTQVGG